jgi:spore coat polysaccharide biosynthesis protein SpsF
LLDGLAHATQLDGVVLATSVDASDDLTEEFARQRGLPCFRGSLADVARRMLQAGESQRADAIVRINGDSPLLDPVLVDRGASLFRQHDIDIVTNVCPRSFPKGQSVEVISLAALRRAVAAMSTPDEREHVTPFIYAHREMFSLQAFMADTPRPEMQLSVDDQADFERCEAILAALGVPAWQAGWQACVSACDDLASSRPMRVAQ